MYFYPGEAHCSGRGGGAFIKIAKNTFKSHQIASAQTCEKPGTNGIPCSTEQQCSGKSCKVEEVGHFAGIKDSNKAASLAHAENNNSFSVPDPLNPNYPHPQGFIAYDEPKQTCL